MEAEDFDCPLRLARLARLGVEAEALPPIAEGACVVPRPLRVSRLADEVAVVPPATLTCAAAEALALWIRDDVSPAARRELGVSPVSVAIGTSYHCRARRGGGAGSGRLSEHGFAKGVDVSGFALDKGGAVAIGRSPPDTPARRFEDAVRSAACGRFTTVLGPGANAEHADHLHLDVAQRRSGYRLCQ